MPRWFVPLQGSPIELSRLATHVLPAPPLWVTHEGDEYRLYGSDFDRLTSAEDVYALARTLLPRINGLGRVRFPDWEPITFDRVVQIGDDGGHHHSVWATVEVGRIRVAAQALVTRADGTVDPPPPPPSGDGALVAAVRSESAQDRALRFFSHEPSWSNLYKVYEVIRDDVGGEKGMGLE